MIHHGLSDREVSLLRSVLEQFSAQIQAVGLFGSRATGTARANSDVDLVLYGDIGQPTVDRLWTLFDESQLARTVDVVAYDLIEHPSLKAHIDAVMIPLFSRADLDPAATDREPAQDRAW